MAEVPLVQPINSYYVVIFPKLISVACVPLVKPIHSYYKVIRWLEGVEVEMILVLLIIM